MAKSPIKHKKPVMGLLDRPYRETGTRGFALYPWRAFCIPSQNLALSPIKHVMNIDQTESTIGAEKSYIRWMKQHPIYSTLITLFIIGLIGNIFGEPVQPRELNETKVTETQVIEKESVASEDEIQQEQLAEDTDIPVVLNAEAQTSNNTPHTVPTEQPIANSDVYHVTDVVDGDTIKIRKDGIIETLRLIGIDTPETVDPRKPVQCFGKEASSMAKQLLLEKNVRIESDSTQDTRDKYGRLLVYVFRDDGLFFNKHMIAEGYAYEYTYNVPYKYQAEFKSAQENARSSGKGLWSSDTCNGDPLTDTEVKTDTQTNTTPTANTSGAKYYTSSHYSAKYYYPESCDGWKSLSASNLKSFNSLEELLASYQRTKSPQCE